MYHLKQKCLSGDAKGTFEPEIAKRVLLEQGMDGFVAQLEKAGAL
jgi:hypothetical protein